MSNARNISKAESRFVNATGEANVGPIGINTTASTTEPLRVQVDGLEASLVGRFASSYTDPDAKVGIRLQGVDASQSDTVYTDFIMNAEDRQWGIGFGTSSGSLPLNTGMSKADIIGHDAGYITTPYQPGFYATRADNLGAITSATKIVCPTIEASHGGYNRGNHYNTSTCVFTAPVAGVYMFSWSFIKSSDSGSVSRLYLQLNSVNTLQIRLDSGLDYDHGSLTKTMQLSAGDTVNIYQSAGSNHGEDTYASFSGYLLG